ALLTVRHPEGDIAGLFRLLAENGDDQPLFGSKLALAFRRDFSHKDILGPHFSADADDAVLVQIFQHVLADIRNVASDLLRTKLRIASFLLILLDMDARENVILYKALREQDGILIVVSAPRHECHEDVLP